MPVVIEKILQPSPQDIIDLEKLYQDYAEGFQWQDVQQWQANTANVTLYGARFNGRLLGAIAAHPQNSVIELNYLCVRAVTRRRGVARDLLRLLLPLYQGHTLSVHLTCNNKACENLLTQIGFSQHNLHFTFKP